MVPGHTKNEVDDEFARIANRFYKADVFNTGELLDIIRSLEMNAVQVPAQDVRKWKTTLAEKYRAIPEITEWNYLEITGSQDSRPVLKVKRSSQDTDFVSCFNGSQEFSIMKSSVEDPTLSAVPTYTESAAVDQSMQKNLKGKKLANIREMYSTFIHESRWPTQLQCEQAVRVGNSLGTPEGPTRALWYMQKGASLASYSDNNLRHALLANPYYGVRTIPRRRRRPKPIEAQTHTPQ